MTSHPATGPAPGRGPLFWVSALAGWSLIAWGIRGAFHHHVDTRPAELARFFLAGPLIHDLVFAPLVLGGGALVARLAPARRKAAVQSALLVSGVVVLFSYPEIRGYAHILHNPTSLPHNYTGDTAMVVGAVAATALILSIVRTRPRHR